MLQQKHIQQHVDLPAYNEAKAARDEALADSKKAEEGFKRAGLALVAVEWKIKYGDSGSCRACRLKIGPTDRRKEYAIKHSDIGTLRPHTIRGAHTPDPLTFAYLLLCGRCMYMCDL